MELSKYLRSSKKMNHNFFFVINAVWDLPFPHDASVSGDEIIFSAREAISFKVSWSMAFKKCSTGFLQHQQNQADQLLEE